MLVGGLLHPVLERYPHPTAAPTHILDQPSFRRGIPTCLGVRDLLNEVGHTTHTRSMTGTERRIQQFRFRAERSIHDINPYIFELLLQPHCKPYEAHVVSCRVQAALRLSQAIMPAHGAALATAGRFGYNVLLYFAAVLVRGCQFIRQQRCCYSSSSSCFHR